MMVALRCFSWMLLPLPFKRRAGFKAANAGSYPTMPPYPGGQALGQDPIPSGLNGADDRSILIRKLMGLPTPFSHSLGAICERASNQHTVAGARAHLLPPTSTGRLGISRVQDLAASFRQRKELRCKPYYPIGMGLLYLTEIAATNFLGGGRLRHF